MKKLFLFIFSLMFFCSSWADAASDRLAQLLGNLYSMQANFSQVTTDSGGSRILQKGTGQMALQRPGKFYWSSVTPTKQILIADGNYVWVYDVDLAQATRQKLSELKSTNPASLLSGTTEALQQRFNVTQIKRSNGGEWFELRPKAKGDLFEWIQLHFQNNTLTEMQLSDNLGQKSVLKFSNIKTNAPLDSNLFRFQPTGKVDVISE